MIYLITDTHFGHDKIIEYNKRPKYFERVIFNNLKSVEFGTNDVMIHLGDFCLSSKNELMYHKKYIELLKNKGVKNWLILGNHDKKSISWYLDKGWDFVGHEIELYYFGYNFIFSHKPIYPERPGKVNVHGHIHLNPYYQIEHFHWPVIIEQNYEPIKLKTIVKFLQRGKW